MFQLFLILSFVLAAHALSDDEAAKFSNSGEFCGIMDVVDLGDSFRFSTNGVPDHPWENVNPNDVIAQEYIYNIPKIPTRPLRAPGCLPGGPVGLSVNGVPIYNPLTSSGLNAVEGTSQETFDFCDGHPDAMGRYHYHKLPRSCVYKGDPDELVGVALDGYPIYGPLVSDLGREVTTADLDECHGREVHGEYRYHMTRGFPYVLGCFKARVGQNSIQVTYNCHEAAPGILCSCRDGHLTEEDVTINLKIRGLIDVLLNKNRRNGPENGHMIKVIDNSPCDNKKHQS